MGKELPERGPKEKLPKSSTRGLLKEENREYSRVEGLWPVSIDTAFGPIHGEVKNISLTGALILAPELPDPNQSFKLAIDIPEYDYASWQLHRWSDWSSTIVTIMEIFMV